LLHRTEQKFVLASMRLRNHAEHQWSVSGDKMAKRYIQDTKFGMLQVRENEIPLRIWSGGTAHAHMVWWCCAAAHLRGKSYMDCLLQTFCKQ